MILPSWTQTYTCVSAAAFISALNVGLSCSILCINRQLYRIASVASVNLSAKQVSTFTAERSASPFKKSPFQKRRDLYIDLAIGLGIPIVHAGLRES